MSDPVARFLLVGVVLLVVLVVVVIVRNMAGSPQRRLNNTGFAPGIYFFTSSACADCGPVREALDKRLGPGAYVEYSWETDRETVESLKIDIVPATLVVGEDGSATLWTGSPDAMFSAIDP